MIQHHENEEETGIHTYLLSNHSTQPDPKLIVAIIIAALLQQGNAIVHLSKVVHTLLDIHRTIAANDSHQRLN